MKLIPTTLLLTSLTLLTSATTSPTSTISYPSTTTSTTSITAHPDLEIRQVAAGLVDPDATLAAAGPAGPVTNYEINSQIGPSTATYIAVAYTQKFPNVPDQWPSAKPGVIGYGDLQKRSLEERAREMEVQEASVVQPRAAVTGAGVQPVVLQMVTEVVTVPVRRVTSIVVVETITVGGNHTGVANGTATVAAGNGTLVGSYGTGVGTLGASGGVGTDGPLFMRTG